MTNENESHAKYSPSQLPRIIRCPGSVNMTKDLPEETSIYAEEGTMLHSVMENLLAKKIYSVPDKWKQNSKIEKSVEPKFSLDEEQCEAVNDCLDFIFTLLASQKHDYYETVECKVTLAGFADIHDCPELSDVYGTVDYSLSIIINKHLYVIDWKFGKGIEVFPDSEQLKAYALAKLKNPKVLKNFDKVTIIIGQPRLYMGETFKQQDFHPEELYSWAVDDLVPALIETRLVNPPLRPSDKACQWCKAKSTCKARRDMNLHIAQEVFKVHAYIPNQITDETIQEMLNLRAKSKDLITYLKDIDKFLVQRLKNAQEVPGMKVVEGKSNRKWKNPDKVMRFLLDELKEDWDDIHNDAPLKSPAQMEKFLGRKRAKDEKFTNLIEKPPGKPTMVPESDKRKAIEYKSVSDIFSEVINEK